MGDKWIDDIRHSMESFETAAPEEIWNGVVRKRRNRRKAVVWLWLRRTVAVAVCISALVAVGYLAVNDVKDDVSLDTGSFDVVASSEEVGGDDIVDNNSAHKSEQRVFARDIAEKQNVAGTTRGDYVSENVKVDDVLSTDEALADAGGEVEEEKNGVNENEDVKDAENERDKPVESDVDVASQVEKIGNDTHKQLPEYKEDVVISAYKAKRKVSRGTSISIGLYSGVMGAGEGNSREYNSEGGGGSIGVPDEEPDSIPDSSVNKLKIVHENGEFRHNLPIKTGLSLTFRCSERLSFMTGLTYSYLTSDREMRYGEQEQRLHFVGVPVGLNFRVFSWKNFDVYSSVGMEVEKCVSASVRSRDFGKSSHMTESLSSAQWQISAKAGVGIQYNISELLGIYAEPGFAYYFDSGSSVESYYSDNPCNFSLMFGVRVRVK
ncbi:MAG: hypothetical protein ACI30M_01115 [Muribaculaceae bacterium]